MSRGRVDGRRVSRARLPGVGGVLAAALGVAGLGGCTTLSWLLHPPPRIAACPGPLLPTQALPGDFLLRERVRIRGGEVDLGLDLVVEKRGEELVLVALNAFGAKAFAVTQRGLEVEEEAYLGRALQVPPGNVLADLHQARFRGGETPDRVVVARPGCGYEAVFVRVPPATAKSSS